MEGYETDRYLLACCRYVELNPVRARMVATPTDYPWSSHKVKLGEARDQLLDLDPCYLALGNTQTQRVQRYRKWVDETIPDHERAALSGVKVPRSGSVLAQGLLQPGLEGETFARLEIQVPV
ncbi:MAG: hypothetical protein OES46_18405 [Gammaproteobacteria bacterium]|nr:hypothetical protein [Gammaproteobacteria bacterium]